MFATLLAVTLPYLTGTGASRVLACLVVAIITMAPVAAADEADASTRSAVRTLGKEAYSFYQANDYENALDRFTRAHELVPLTTTGLWRARCLDKLGRLVEASEQYRAVTLVELDSDARDIHRKAQTDAAAELVALEPRIAHLKIQIEGSVPEGTTIRLDGKDVPPALLGVQQPADPGSHVLEVVGAGTMAEKPFELEEGATTVIPLKLVDRGPQIGVATSSSASGMDTDPGLSQRVLGGVVIGVGSVGLVVGAVTGGLALSQKSGLDSNCPENNCLPELHDDIDDFETMRLASTVSFIAGGVLAAAGLTIVLTAPASVTEDRGEAAVPTITLSPYGAMVRGSF